MGAREFIEYLAGNAEFKKSLGAMNFTEAAKAIDGKGFKFTLAELFSVMDGIHKMIADSDLDLIAGGSGIQIIR